MQLITMLTVARLGDLRAVVFGIRKFEFAPELGVLYVGAAWSGLVGMGGEVSAMSRPVEVIVG